MELGCENNIEKKTLNMWFQEEIDPMCNIKFNMNPGLLDGLLHWWFYKVFCSIDTPN